uniref:Uncharacterized protein n=1 Tax=Romanomermis culicivorax TaxID=13658 RepID=A0A915KKF1_ROMCU
MEKESVEESTFKGLKTPFFLAQSTRLKILKRKLRTRQQHPENQHYLQLIRNYEKLTKKDGQKTRGKCVNRKYGEISIADEEIYRLKDLDSKRKLKVAKKTKAKYESEDFQLNMKLITFKMMKTIKD